MGEGCEFQLCQNAQDLLGHLAGPEFAVQCAGPGPVLEVPELAVLHDDVDVVDVVVPAQQPRHPGIVTPDATCCTSSSPILLSTWYRFTSCIREKDIRLGAVILCANEFECVGGDEVGTHKG